MPRRSLVVAAALLLVASAAAPAQEAKSKTTGLLLGLHLNGTAAQYEDTDETESGGGLGFTVGYGFTPNFTLYMTADAGILEFSDWLWSGRYSMGHFDLGVRYMFANAGRTVVPYLDGAVTGRAIASEVEFILGGASYRGDIDITGSGLSAGGGLEIFFSPKLALDMGLKFSVGNFNSFKIEGQSIDLEDAGATTTRFNLGLSWRP
jgi:hypothetical protein